ncbi:MAG: nuclear transport factor 2 family protein [Bacteroidota bacterium]
MPNPIEERILNLEEQLRNAMLQADLTTLDKLIHDDLQFMIPGGVIMTKAMDLAAYQSGQMQISSLEADKPDIEIFDNVASVSVVAHVQGSFNEQIIDGRFRYLRIWKQFGDQWQIIAGASSQVS